MPIFSSPGVYVGKIVPDEGDRCGMADWKERISKVLGDETMDRDVEEDGGSDDRLSIGKGRSQFGGKLVMSALISIGDLSSRRLLKTKVAIVAHEVQSS